MIDGADIGRVKNPSFYQPLMAGLFCLLLILLFLVTALMDARRTQNTLLDVFENKGATIIETVEMLAQDKLNGLMRITNRSAVSFQDLESIEEGFRMQEAILGRLIEVGRAVDRQAAEKSLTKKELEQWAVEAGVRVIVLYDALGEITLQSAPVPKELAPRIKLLLEGGNEIVVDLNGEDRSANPTYLVGVRRKNPEGMIILVFGQEGLQYWAPKVIIQEAVEEGGWRKGVHYFMVVDSRGRLLAGAGDLPDADSGKVAQSNVEQVLKRDERSGRRIIKGSPALLEVFAPLIVNGRKAGFARIGMEIEEASRLRARNLTGIFFSSGLMMMAAVFGMLLFYRLQIRHLRRIQEMKERLVQAERLSALGRLAAGVAHEIRNPLNAVSMAIQRIHREFSPPRLEDQREFSHLITVVREEIRRLNRIIEEFVSPVRIRRTEFRPERLVDLFERVVRLLREEAGARDIRIECHYEDPDIVIDMDAARMHQAVFNLIKNALESIPGRGTITVAARRHGSQHVVITITDTGVGIPPEAVKRILDFEYTTKEKGLGLGLPIAKEIIEAHGGKIRIESQPGKGTEVELVLPRREK